MKVLERTAVVMMVGMAALSSTAGCGGGSTAGGGEATSYADAVCSVLSAHLNEEQEIGNGAQINTADIANSNTDANKKVLSALASYDQSVADELGNIQPPAEIADMHKDIVDAYRKLGDGAVGIRDALGNSPDEAVATIQAVEAGLPNPQGLYSKLPDNYQQAFKDSEVCKSLSQTTPTPAE